MIGSGGGVNYQQVGPLQHFADMEGIVRLIDDDHCLV
jgi:hypothetical protein